MADSMASKMMREVIIMFFTLLGGGLFLMSTSWTRALTTKEAPSLGNETAGNYTHHPQLHVTKYTSVFTFALILAYLALYLQGRCKRTGVVSAMLKARVSTLLLVLLAFVVDSENDTLGNDDADPVAYGAFSCIALARLIEIVGFSGFFSEEETRTVMNHAEDGPERKPPRPLTHLLMLVVAAATSAVVAFSYESHVEESGTMFGIAVALVALVTLFCFYPKASNPWLLILVSTGATIAACIGSTQVSNLFQSPDHEIPLVLIASTSLAVFAATCLDAPTVKLDADFEHQSSMTERVVCVLVAAVVFAVCSIVYFNCEDCDWDQSGRLTDLNHHAMALNLTIAVVYVFGVLEAAMHRPLVVQETAKLTRFLSAIMLAVAVAGSLIHQTSWKVSKSAIWGDIKTDHGYKSLHTAELEGIEIFAIAAYGTLFLGSSVLLQFRSELDKTVRKAPMLAGGIALVALLAAIWSAHNPPADTGGNDVRAEHDKAVEDADHATTVFTFMVTSVCLAGLYVFHFYLRVAKGEGNMLAQIFSYATYVVEGLLIGFIASIIGVDYLNDRGYRLTTTPVLVIALVFVFLAVRVNTRTKDTGAEDRIAVKFNFWDRYGV